MISWRLAVPVVLSAAVFAAWLTYFLRAPPPVATDRQATTVGQVLEADMGSPANIDRRPSAEEIANAFRQAAAAPSERLATEAQPPAEVQEMPAGTDEPAIAGTIPLPKRRPIPRP
jgi:hypothetical protein